MLAVPLSLLTSIGVDSEKFTNLPNLSNIHWGEQPKTGRVDGVSFPGFLDNRQPTIISNGRFEKSTSSGWVVGQAMASPGSSGSGVFWTENHQTSYIGPLVTVFSTEAVAQNNQLMDNITCFPLAAYGPENVQKLIDEAIEDLNRKK